MIADLGCGAVPVMTTDEERINWEIANVRRAIDSDWAQLASQKLPAEKRKVIREHLAMNIESLRDLVARNRAALQRAKLERDGMPARSGQSSTPRQRNLDEA